MNNTNVTENAVLKINRNRLRQAINIIEIYNPNKALNDFLRGFYNKNKNIGSADRKHLSNLLYQYFRLGKNFQDLTIEEKISISLLFGNNERKAFVEFMINEYSSFVPTHLLLPIEKKIDLVRMKYPSFSMTKLFPFSRYLSVFNDVDLFIQSHLQQPNVWIRIKKDKIQEVIAEINEAGYEYEIAPFADTCICFLKHYPLHELQNYHSGNFEIQDAGSQLTGNYFKPNPNEIWWDACSGSGGKSLMLIDREPSVSLLLTDIRESIIKHLQERFERSKIKNFKTLTADLSMPHPVDIPFEFFDGIILDVPCSGSGTWAATPEMLVSFDIESLSKHHKIQTTIAQHVLPYLKVGKPLIYITCSVYKQENEDVVNFLCDNFNMTLESQQIIEGFRYGASTFFVARLIKQ
jgi:16S rRNA (cytosine967-C5)-methyltransferase